MQMRSHFSLHCLTQAIVVLPLALRLFLHLSLSTPLISAILSLRNNRKLSINYHYGHGGFGPLMAAR